ncbi:MAG: phosphate ABC transporter ATP-binding protein, partial [Solirubrobacterales bacterium]
MEELTPPPIRRLTPGTTPDVVPAPAAVPPASTNGHGTLTPPAAPSAPVAPAQSRTSPLTYERMLVEDFSVYYGDKPAVKNVTLPVRQGEVLALIGPSGCGKTTLLRSINRLIDITPGASTTGEITLDGIPISEIDATALRRLVTMVFQQPNPFPMSVFDNIAYVLREQASKRPRRKDLQGAVLDALTRAGLAAEVGDKQDHPALRLSGGQQQRL